jgi:branched-chain amino acid transport system ATP-binding protein
VLKITDLSVRYDGVLALEDVFIEVRPGEIVAVVGANGAGKSTLLAAISGLLRHTTGSISFQGQELIGKEAYEIVGRGVVHVPEGRRLFPFLTVEENLWMGAYPAHARSTRLQLIEEIYAMLPRLAERRTQLANTLSGGEQQMCAIGRGLMSKPNLLMLDEPTLGLAPILASEVLQIADQIRKRGTTLILVEQQVGKALKLADRGYVLERGRVVMQNTGALLLADANLRRAYMGI